MKLHQLRALVAAAEAGSIHEAARALHVTQPAVTRALHDLEDELGLTLLVRSSSGVALTGEGRTMLARAELVLNEVGRTEEEMGRLRDSRRGHVAIGLTPLAGSTIVPHAYNRFRKDMPDVTLEFIELSAPQLVDQLKSGAMDFALGSGTDPRDFASLRCVPLAVFPMWFAVSRSGSLAGANSLADLQEAEWMHTGASAEFRAFLSNLFRRAGLSVPQRVTRCTSQALFYNLAVNSDVVTSWTQAAMHNKLAAAELKVLDLPEQPPARKLFLLFRENTILTAPAEYFVRCVEAATAMEQEGRAPV